MSASATIVVFPSAEALATAVAEHIVGRAAGAIAGTGRFTLVLAGGSTPGGAYALLGGEAFRHRIEWNRVHVLWSDERGVPPEDPRSNYRMARETLLDRVPLPDDQIHRIRGEDDPDRAAADYERTLRALLRADTRDPSHPTGLDLVLLGMGDDGHTASLFPGQPAVRETERWVVATGPDAEGMRRITLTPVVLNRARHVTFVVSGGGKAARAREVLRGPLRPEALPAQAIRPSAGRLTWMMDEAAMPRWR
jgi:6-phosphogluconolactonase